MIIGTAGHVDHGKTLLVRAITGVDTDRLPEEKARGMSIELGYAYQPLPDGGVLGFIDVPGHERFIRTMLAGAAGIDFSLLVVAADDGVMPQTREHLAILDLLGVARGAVALTKIDRVDAQRLEGAQREVIAHLATTALRGAPLFPVSALTGEGIDALRAHLHAEAARSVPRAAHGGFRLAVDRSFTLPGTGTVVTGTVFSGAVRVGDDAIVTPSGRVVRVRGLHAQNQPAPVGRAGERCALNLAGVDKDAIARGDWIVAPELHRPTDRFDARIRLASGAVRGLAQGAAVHLHLGATHVVARIALLDRDRLEPADQALAQVVLDRPIGALYGDAFILRDAQARQTLGGGRVLDITAPARQRRSPERLRQLAALACDDPRERLARLLEEAEWGVDLVALGGSWNQPLIEAHLREGDRLIVSGAQRVAIAASRWATLRERLLDGLAQYHARCPDEPGPDASRLRRMIVPKLPAPAFSRLVEALESEGLLARTGAWLHLPEHRIRLSPQETAVASRLRDLLRVKPYDPPWVRDLARATGQDEAFVRVLMKKLARQGEAYQIVRDLYFDGGAVAALLTEAAAAAEDGVIRAAAFRDRIGIGRKRSIQILEFFDRIGYTRRVGDVHVLRGDLPDGGPAGKPPSAACACPACQ